MEQVRSSPAPYFGQVSLHLCVCRELDQGPSALSTLQQRAYDPARVACRDRLCWTPATGTEYLLINKLAVLDAGSQVNFTNPFHVSRQVGLLIPSTSIRCR